MTPADLTTARKGLSLTQAQLAAALGISRDAVISWETGRRPLPAWMPTALQGIRCGREH